MTEPGDSLLSAAHDGHMLALIQSALLCPPTKPNIAKYKIFK